jgi:hypothetical protein
MPDETPTTIPTNELDILVVKNIDIDCNDIDSEEGYSHKDYFQARWSGKPHRIPPGETKRMPRFLAEHFAKHLADHVLMKMEAKFKSQGIDRRGLVQSPIERPRVLKEILVAVDTHYGSDFEINEGEKVANQVKDLNPEEKAIDLGEAVNPMVGILKPEPVPIVQDVVATEPAPATPTTPPAPASDTSIWDDKKPKPSHESLVADCVKLGIEITGKETSEDLIAKIKAF